MYGCILISLYKVVFIHFFFEGAQLATLLLALQAPYSLYYLTVSIYFDFDNIVPISFQKGSSFAIHPLYERGRQTKTKRVNLLCKGQASMCKEYNNKNEAVENDCSQVEFKV